MNNSAAPELTPAATPNIKPRVMIADADAVTRRLLKSHLIQYCGHIHEASSAEEMFDSLGPCNPHVIVLDSLLPNSEGIRTLRLLRGKSEVGVVMISVSGDREFRLHALRNGADDYIQKPIDEQELTLKVVRMATRIMRSSGESVDQRSFDVMGLHVCASERSIYCVSEPKHTQTLTPAELTCMVMLNDHYGKTCQRESLHTAVSGISATTTTPRSVDTIIGRLRAKIAVFSVPIIIETVRGQGYRLAPKIDG